jgi:hypothetical protein
MDDIEKRQDEITAEVAKMSISELADLMADHGCWFTEFIENAYHIDDEGYDELAYQAAVIAEVTNRLLAFERSCKTLDELDNGETK